MVSRSVLRKSTNHLQKVQLHHRFIILYMLGSYKLLFLLWHCNLPWVRVRESVYPVTARSFQKGVAIVINRLNKQHTIASECVIRTIVCFVVPVNSCYFINHCDFSLYCFLVKYKQLSCDIVQYAVCNLYIININETNNFNRSKFVGLAYYSPHLLTTFQSCIVPNCRTNDFVCEIFCC